MKGSRNKAAVVAMLVCMAMAVQCMAGALSAPRDTHQRDGETVGMLAATNVTIYAGAIVCENGSGRVVPGADASGYAVIGRAEASVDTVGDLVATKIVTARRGVFLWANGGSFTDANVGDLAYVADDQTVTTAAAATYDIVAGVIIDVETSGVWVDTYAIGGQGAASVTTLSASGAASLGSTLSVAGAAALNGGLTMDSSAFAVADTTGVITMKGGATLDNNASATELNITETTVKVTGAFVATGAAQIGVLSTVSQTATTRTCTSADYGKVIIVATNDAVAITLPANGAAAGSWIDFMIAGSDDCAPTVSAATTDTLIGPNDVDLKSVTYGTSHRIGAYLRCISDGTFWHAINVGSTTMTGND